MLKDTGRRPFQGSIPEPGIEPWFNHSTTDSAHHKRGSSTGTHPVRVAIVEVGPLSAVVAEAQVVRHHVVGPEEDEEVSQSVTQAHQGQTEGP